MTTNDFGVIRFRNTTLLYLKLKWSLQASLFQRLGINTPLRGKGITNLYDIFVVDDCMSDSIVPQIPSHSPTHPIGSDKIRSRVGWLPQIFGTETQIGPPAFFHVDAIGID